MKKREVDDWVQRYNLEIRATLLDKLYSLRKEADKVREEIVRIDKQIR